MSTLFRSALIWALGVCASASAFAMPPRPGTVSAEPKSGAIDVKVRRIGELKPICSSAPAPSVALSGKHRLLVILVDTADSPWPASGYGKSRYQELIFDRSTSSMREYFRENSYGAFDLDGEVVGPVRAPGRLADYTYKQTAPDNKAVIKLIAAAIKEAKKGIDLDRFDTHDSRGRPQKDGIIDHVMVLYAEPTGKPDGFAPIWPHRGTTDLEVEGKRLASYSIFNHAARLGVYVHEFSHDLGVPDLYDRDYTSYGAGDWCTMASGGWLGDSERPAHLSAWAKLRLGWINPVLISKPSQNVAVPSSSERAFALKIPIGEVDSPEYFLVENRRRVGFDDALPAEGLLIWHIDERKGDNDDESHKMVDLVEASKVQDLDTLSNLRAPNYTADIYSGKDRDLLSDETEPSARSYDGTPSGIRIKVQTASERVMSIDVDRPPIFHPGGVPFVLSKDGYNFGRFANVPLPAGSEALMQLEATPGDYLAYAAEVFVVGPARSKGSGTLRIYEDKKGQPGKVLKEQKLKLDLPAEGYSFVHARIAEGDKGLRLDGRKSYWVGVSLDSEKLGVAINPLSTSRSARYRNKQAEPLKDSFRFRDTGVTPVSDYIIRLSGFGYLTGSERPEALATDDDPLVLRLVAADRDADAGKKDAAMVAYRAIIQEMEKDARRFERWLPVAVNALGVVAYETGHYDEALERFEATLRRSLEAADEPSSADVHENLCETAFAAGQLERARDEAERSRQINLRLSRFDRLVENLYWGARAEQELGKKGEAEPKLREAGGLLAKAFAKDASSEAEWKRRIAAALAGNPEDRPSVKERGEELNEKSKNRKQKVVYTDLLQFLGDDTSDP